MFNRAMRAGDLVVIDNPASCWHGRGGVVASNVVSFNRAVEKEALRMQALVWVEMIDRPPCPQSGMIPQLFRVGELRADGRQAHQG